ncbi:MAG: hypothetical protein WBS33_02680 [Verrucomicrobiia bacterium]
MNHHIKRILFKSYAVISITVFIAAILVFICRFLSWEEFAGIAVGVFAFAFGVQKQNLREIKLFKELFEQFNDRYDKMNDDLNQIHEQPSDLTLTKDEKEKLFKYFNLCGEEWLYAKRGFICEEVWKAWKSGMDYFRRNSRIKDFWDKELNDNDSYYGLEF